MCRLKTESPLLYFSGRRPRSEPGNEPNFCMMTQSFPRAHLLAAACFSLIFAQAACGTQSECSEAATTAQMRACAAQDYQAADAELNRIYNDLRARLSGTQRERLVAAQRAWIVFRDRQAAFAAGVAEGGTLAPLLDVSERATLTRKRTEQLRRYPHNQ